MLKVVGASWFQTRLSTYILVAVALLGIGAIVLGQFEKAQNDGTYSATVIYNKAGYRIEFLGQGNDLSTIPAGVARGYYKTRMHKVGWSTIEIETSSSFPDGIQAHAAGLLEGSLTWQMIYHHWYNTIGTVCIDYESTCEKVRKQLRENSEEIKERAKLLSGEDSFWHMVRLFYFQLDGLISGWRYGVSRSLNEYEIPDEDFIWMAAASNFINFGSNFRDNTGAIFIKNLMKQQNDLTSMLAIIHGTSAPYFKMLRLLKKYTFGFHLTNSKNSNRLPTRSIVFSSYPGALSSQDEYYILYGEEKNKITVLAGIPLKKQTVFETPEETDFEPVVLNAPKIMATNWLSSNGRSWSHLLARPDLQKSSMFFTSFQWIITHSSDLSDIWLVEQYPTMTHSIEFTQILKNKDNILCDGTSFLNRDLKHLVIVDVESKKNNPIDYEIKNEDIKSNDNPMELNNKPKSGGQNFSLKMIKNIPELDKIINYRGDLDNKPAADGIIDIKMSVIDDKGLIKFEAKSGPPITDNKFPFEWSESFSNTHHTGQPKLFNFDITSPNWVWF